MGAEKLRQIGAMKRKAFVVVVVVAETEGVDDDDVDDAEYDFWDRYLEELKCDVSVL